MNRSIYKSFAETMQMVSFRIILGIKAAYYRLLLTFEFDLSNAFQNTRTDRPGQEYPPIYCYQAPGFERRGSNGERLVCQVDAGMQGRIDATRIFESDKDALLKIANVFPLKWDKKVYLYHNTSLVGTDSPLSAILRYAHDHQHEDMHGLPVGWALVGTHVDDGLGLASS